jgi:hypothetical protein
MHKRTAVPDPRFAAFLCTVVKLQGPSLAPQPSSPQPLPRVPGTWVDLRRAKSSSWATQRIQPHQTYNGKYKEAEELAKHGQQTQKSIRLAMDEQIPKMNTNPNGRSPPQPTTPADHEAA